MPRVTDPEEMKQNILREILRSLGLPERPEYFSGGSTVRTEALRAIRDEIHHRRRILENVSSSLDELLTE